MATQQFTMTFTYDDQVWTNARINNLCREFDPLFAPSANNRVATLKAMSKKTILEYDRAARQAAVVPQAEDATGVDIT